MRVCKEHVELGCNRPGVVCFHGEGAVMGGFPEWIENRAEGGGVKEGGESGVHVCCILPGIFGVLLFANQEGLIVFICPLCAGEELGRLCVVCWGGAPEGGEVLAKGLVGA